MSIVRVGSTQKFSDNWDDIFSSGKRKPTAKASKNKTPKKTAAKQKTVRAKPAAKKKPRGK